METLLGAISFKFMRRQKENPKGHISSLADSGKNSIVPGKGKKRKETQVRRNSDSDASTDTSIEAPCVGN